MRIENNPRVKKVVTVEKKERELHLTFLVDVSGSMKFNQCKEGTKNRLEAALSGVEMIFNEVLRPSDLVTLIAFDDAIHTVVPLKKKSEVLSLSSSLNFLKSSSPLLFSPIPDLKKKKILA